MDLKNEINKPVNTKKTSILDIFKGISKQSRSMRSKLMLYLFCLVLAGTGILLLLLVAGGVFSESGTRLEQYLQVHLQNQKKDIKERVDLFTTNGIDLSKRLSGFLEREVLSYPYDIKSLDNNEV